MSKDDSRKEYEKEREKVLEKKNNLQKEYEKALEERNALPFFVEGQQSTCDGDNFVEDAFSRILRRPYEDAIRKLSSLLEIPDSKYNQDPEERLTFKVYTCQYVAFPFEKEFVEMLRNRYYPVEVTSFEHVGDEWVLTFGGILSEHKKLEKTLSDWRWCGK